LLDETYSSKYAPAPSLVLKLLFPQKIEKYSMNILVIMKKARKNKKVEEI